MKKYIKVCSAKTSSKPIEERLTVGNAADDLTLKKRIITITRVKQLAEAALAKAVANGDEALAAKLRAKIDELTELADGAYVDTIDLDEPVEPQANDTNTDEDDDESSGSNSDDEGDDEGNDSTDSNDDDDDDDNEDESSDGGASDDPEGFHDEDDDDLDNEGDGGDDEEGGEEPEEEENPAPTPQPSQQNDQDDSDENEDADDESEEDSEEEDEEEEESSSDGSHNQGGDLTPNNTGKGSKAKQDIFADEEDIPQLPFTPGGHPIELDDSDWTLEEIIGYLNALPEEARAGAKEALKDLIASRVDTNESLTKHALHEAVTKTLRDLSDDEFGDIINDTQDLIDRVTPINYSKDIDQRRIDIQRLQDQTDMETRELSKENSQDADTPGKAQAAIKAKSREASRYANLKSIDQFELDLWDTVREQVRQVQQQQQSYQEINNEYESENAIVKADVVRRLDELDVPVIKFYYDVSGSWESDSRAEEIGKRIAATLNQFEEQGLIQLDVKYFANHVESVREVAAAQGGTSAWYEILADIKADDATNVILMTDDDMDSQARSGSTVTVPGCVWFIWRGKRRCPDIVKHLRGLTYTDEYTF